MHDCKDRWAIQQRLFRASAVQDRAEISRYTSDVLAHYRTCPVCNGTQPNAVGLELVRGLFGDGVEVVR